MMKIDSRSAQVHFLFEGLLSGDIQTFTPLQKEIIIFAMSKTYPGLKARQKAHEKASKRMETTRRSFNQEGRHGKQQREPLGGGQVSALQMVTLWFKRVCYICIGLLFVVLIWSIYSQYF